MKKIGLISILVVILIILSFALYWNLNKDKYSGGFFNALFNLKGSNCRYEDPDLCKFINNWGKITAYTETTKPVIEGINYVQVFKYDGDKSYQIFITENNSETKNEIIIDKTIYVKDFTDNKWTKSDIKVVPKNYLLDFYNKLNNTEDKTTYKKIAKEDCNGEQCLKYQVIIPENSQIKQFIYIGLKNHNLIKSVHEPNYGTINESTYNFSPVNITQPELIK